MVRKQRIQKQLFFEYMYVMILGDISLRLHKYVDRVLFTYMSCCIDSCQLITLSYAQLGTAKFCSFYEIVISFKTMYYLYSLL